MRHYPYAYTLWYNLAQAMKCDIYLKLWSYAQNCLICTLHPLYCDKKLSIRYGAHKPVRVSCSHCHVVDVMNDIILYSYAGFVLNVCLLNHCGKCICMAINTFWIWIWIPQTNIDHSLLECEKSGKTSTGPTQKLISSFTVISDLYRSIRNQTILPRDCSPGALKSTE